MSLDNLKIERTNSCCGVEEINGVSWLEKDEIDVLLTEFEVKVHDENDYFYTGPWRIKISHGMYFFADRVNKRRNSLYPGHGKDFAEEIKKRGIGKLWETDEFKNPNNRNTIKAWLWLLTKEDIKQAKAAYKEKNKDAKSKKPKQEDLRTALGA